jgi:hypothetical protein
MNLEDRFSQERISSQTEALLAQPNYGDNTCPPGFGNNHSETIFFFPITSPLRLPKSVRACRFHFHRM